MCCKRITLSHFNYINDSIPNIVRGDFFSFFAFGRLKRDPGEGIDDR